jgi:cytochrome c oxidase assembly protein subunit 15
MNASVAPYDFAPVASLLLLGALLALVPLGWVWRRHAAAPTPAARASARLQALTLLTLALTFDLVLFGAFTRLTDSGLGCPDWPGCYGSTSPLGAQAHIDAAQAALPSGPVTHGKAWIEMTHRYLASGVGALIVVLAAINWRIALRPVRARADAAPWWASATLVWVCVQGLFGALTVTLKLYPLVVTAHLLGGMALLALLAVQAQLQRGVRQPLSEGLWRGALALALLSMLQIALGGWVSTHYAVLACSEFPQCQGSWWPAMDFEQGFTLLHDLNHAPDGSHLPFAALTAIHYTHRLVAYAVLTAMLGFAWRLWRSRDAALRRWAFGVLAIAAWQLVSGVSNVVLGWPLVAAVAHTAGAAAWVVLLSSLLTRAMLARPATQVSPAASQRWQPAP